MDFMIRNDPKPAFRVINTKKVTQNSYIILITVREGQYRLRVAQQASLRVDLAIEPAM